MPVAFTELNRNRPPAGIDFVTHATQATVHAADDVSVMETLETLPHLVRSIRAMAGPVHYRVGLASIGAPGEVYYAPPAANPHRRRVAQAAEDPRQQGLFAAAFALGYAAAAAQAGVDAVTLGAATGGAGVLNADGTARPVAMVVAGLAALAGSDRVATDVAGTGIAALAARAGGGRVLWLANLTARPIVVTVPPGFARLWLMDAAALAGMAPDAIADAAFAGETLALDTYAVCRLS
jgi:hypothetical protein